MYNPAAAEANREWRYAEEHIVPGTLIYNGNNVASCTRCNWRGCASKNNPVCPDCGIPDPRDEFPELFIDEPKYERVGRNDSCPCGSGTKAKKCHPEFTR